MRASKSIIIIIVSIYCLIHRFFPLTNDYFPSTRRSYVKVYRAKSSIFPLHRHTCCSNSGYRGTYRCHPHLLKRSESHFSVKLISIFRTRNAKLSLDAVLKNKNARKTSSCDLRITQIGKFLLSASQVAVRDVHALRSKIS